MILDFCVACGTKEDLNQHHLVPRINGGGDEESNLITLCHVCHGKIHGLSWVHNHKELTKQGLARVKASGQVLGRPRNEVFSKVQDLKGGGMSQTKVVKTLGVSLSTVRRNWTTNPSIEKGINNEA